MNCGKYFVHVSFILRYLEFSLFNVPKSAAQLPGRSWTFSLIWHGLTDLPSEVSFKRLVKDAVYTLKHLLLKQLWISL